MDFYSVFDQVLDLLRQRGRVSYRALKLQFQEVYGWFTEGFDTADLQEANLLLEQLA